MSASNAPSAVVDTDVFVSGTINPHGRPRQVLRAWHEGRFKLVLSDRQHAELITVFGRPKIIRQFRITLIEPTELIVRIEAITPIVPNSSIPVHTSSRQAWHMFAVRRGRAGLRGVILWSHPRAERSIASPIPGT